jgi:RHS repeat-associated protein
MQPDLALVYDSGNGNGILGMGWSLAGLSSITRCNYGNGINYDGADSYCHSDLGVLVRQPDGSYRSKKESFTKFVPSGTCGDGPCSWTAYDRTGIQLSYGTTPDSSLLTRNHAFPPTSVRQWALTRVLDLFGNSYSVTYTNDAENGWLYPSSIDYTYGPGLTTHRTIQLEYEGRQDAEAGHAQRNYTAMWRRLKSISVKAGCASSSCAEGSLVRSYRLDYMCGTGMKCSGSETGRSRLIAVTELGSDGTSTLPPLTFGWAQPSASEARNMVPPTKFLFYDSSMSVYVFDAGVNFADLNGDGLLDVIQGNCVTTISQGVADAYDMSRNRCDVLRSPRAGAFINDGTSWKEATAASPEAYAFQPPVYFRGFDNIYKISYDRGVRIMDLNGDGLPDLVQGFYDGSVLSRHAWLNNGGHCNGIGCAWTPADQYAPPVYFAAYDFAGHVWDHGVRIADLDGDGLPDLLFGYDPDAASRIIDVMLGILGYNSTTRAAWINNGTGWSLSPGYAPPAAFVGRSTGTLSGYDEGTRLLELNGDGRPDLVQKWFSCVDQLCSPSGGAWINTGSGWASFPDYTVPEPARFSELTSSYPYGLGGGLRITDLNGDGLADLVLSSDYQGYRSTAVWINSGNGWYPPQDPDYVLPCDPAYAQACPTFDRVWPSFGTYTGGLRAVDLNGDGKADLSWFVSCEHSGLSYSGAAVNDGAHSFQLDNDYVYHSQPSPYGSFDPALGYGPNCEADNVPAAPQWDFLFDQYVDVDGDGRSEQAYGRAYMTYGRIYNDSHIHSFIQPGAYLDLMTSVSNGLGGTVAVTYAPAPQVAGAIQPLSGAPGIANTAAQQLVTTITTTDGRGGSYTSAYEYSDARWYPGRMPDRRNLGFASISVHDGQTGQYTKTTYNQNPGFEGHVSEVDSYTSANQPIQQTIYSYDLVNPSIGTELARERQRRVTTFEPIPTSSYASSQTTATDYDDYGNITVSTQSADNLPTVTVTTTYDPPDQSRWIVGRVTGVKTSSGGVTLKETQYTWTADNITEKREWRDTNSAWLTTAMRYDANGNLTSATEPAAADGLLRRTSLQYDPTYNAYPATVTNALGQSSSMRYYPDGQVQSVTDANSNAIRFDYDVFGRIRSVSRLDGGTTSYTYDGWGDPNAQRNEMCVTLNPEQSSCVERYFDGAGFVYRETNSGTGAQSVTVTHCKDVAGRPSTSSIPYFGANVVSCGDADTSWTTVAYDGASRVSSVTKPDTTVRHLSYGPNPGATPACPAVLATCMQDPNGQVTVRTFDARRQITSVVDTAQQTTSYGYDPLGRLTSVSLPNGQVFSGTYDSLDRKTSTADSRLEATALGYDAVGNLTSMVSAGKTVIMAYDALDRLVRKQAGDEPAVTYTYDEPEFANGRGRLTTVVDQAGTTHLAYTATGLLNNFVRAIDGNDYSQYFTYDWGGRITRVTYPDQGSHADYTYTNEGNLSTVALNDAILGTWSNYTASGRPQNVRHGNGVATTYGYDTVNHLTSLATSRGDTILQNLSYDWYGRPNTGGLNLGSITDNRPSKIAADGSITDETQTYAYDPLYRLTEATGAWGATTPNTYVQKRYEYDSIGNPTAFGGVTDRTLTFNGQQVDTVTGLDGVAWTYTWTAENRLASATKDGVLTARMTYDFSGERAKKVFTPGSGLTVTTTYIGQMYEKRTYSDGSPDRNTVHVFANGQLLASATTAGRVATALRDANRWKSEMAATTMYSWRSSRGVSEKAWHFLKALSLHPQAVSWIVLTLYGLFVIAVVIAYLAAPSTRVSAMSGFSPLLRPVSLAVLFLFTFSGCGGPGGAGLRAAPRNYLIAGDTTNGPALGTYFYHRNHINSNSVITDSNGIEVTRLVYLPFGELSRPNSSGTDTVTSKFTGQEYDEELGLYYYGARYYDPKIGRFLSADPLIGDIGDPQSFNRYSYVENNPIKYIDPTGHYGECPADFCISWPDTGDQGSGTDPGTPDPGRPGGGGSSGGTNGRGWDSTNSGYSSGAWSPPPQPPTPTPYIASDAQTVQGISAPTTTDPLLGSASVTDASSGPGEPLSVSVTQASLNAAPAVHDPASPWQVGWEWLTGTGPRTHTFVDGDPFTELLRQHQHIRKLVEGVSTGRLAPRGPFDYTLSGLEGIPKYGRDYSTLLTVGATGNLAVTFLGSYKLWYSASDGTVSIHVWNISSIASATHPPVIGYTRWWSTYIGGPLNKFFLSGPLSPTRQDFYFHERLRRY